MFNLATWRFTASGWVLVLLTCSSCSERMADKEKVKVLQLINEFLNADFDWDADFVGLSPTIRVYKEKEEMLQLINEISNADVEWDADFFGLSPTLTSNAAKRLVELGEQTISDLVAAMSDPNKFVTAHVILTQLSRVEYQAFPAWNGLVVNIAEDGTVNIDPDQRLGLAKQWELYFQTQPRSNTLYPSI